MLLGIVFKMPQHPMTSNGEGVSDASLDNMRTVRVLEIEQPHGLPGAAV